MKTPGYERSAFSVMEVAKAELIAGFQKHLGNLNAAEQDYVSATVNYHKVEARHVSYFAKALLAGEDCEKVFPGYVEMVQMFLALAKSRSYAESDLDATMQSMIARTLDGTEIMGVQVLTDEEIGVESVDSTQVMGVMALTDEQVNRTMEMKPVFIEEDE